MPKPDLSKIKQALYIKLGRTGGYEKICIQDGTIRLGYHGVPEGMSDKDDLAKWFRGQGKAQGAATNHARQVADFFRAGSETLWITFSDGYLWWAQARKEVHHLGNDKERFAQGSRFKRTINGWSNKTVEGKELVRSELSGRLTRSGNYRGTICEIKGEAFKYLLNKINGVDQPAVKEGKAAKAKTLRSIENLIAMLTPQDFELFVDLLFTSSGWRRVDALGGTTKTVDIELIMPLTNERACVQVKSSTTQWELDEYTEAMSAMPADRIFYVYHTAKGPLNADDNAIALMGPQQLAESALRSGLLDWLIEKVG